MDSVPELSALMFRKSLRSPAPLPWPGTSRNRPCAGVLRPRCRRRATGQCRWTRQFVAHALRSRWAGPGLEPGGRPGVRAVTVRYAPLQQRELIAAQARYHIVLARGLRQLPGHPHQQLVTYGVPVAVIDGFEPVQIHVQDSEATARPVYVGGCGLQCLRKGGAVEQAGQAVVLCHMADQLLGLLALGDVGKSAQRTAAFDGHGLDLQDAAVRPGTVIRRSYTWG